MNVYIGVGIKSPLALVGGFPMLSHDNELIEEALADRLSTPIGTLLMQPEYGSRIHECMFEPNDDILEGLLRTYIEETFISEGRVEFVDLATQPNKAKVNCLISYRNIQTSEIRSFVYPFYRELN